MLSHRAAGLLLHPTSLPGPLGMGDLGTQAYAFVDYLADAKLTRWQILPLGPTGYGDSPYASFSTFAGNHLLISLERLAHEGHLNEGELQPPAEFSAERVNYGPVIEWKLPRLRGAADHFLRHASDERHHAFHEFCQREAAWLDDYALFMAIKEVFDQRAREANFEGATWCNFWDADIRSRQPEALERWRHEQGHTAAIHRVWQFWFFEQWLDVKRYANERGIHVIGDLPIFVALDSADVWAAPHEFRLDQNLQPTHIAGVPPDYFAKTGQRWGNPLYDWPRMQASGFRWWVERFRGIGRMVDWVRVDHFRGFAANWSVPASEPTAQVGQWDGAPGHALFTALRDQGVNVPIIAEDLGEITADVDELREAFGLPGMRILQFAFDAEEGRNLMYLPHNHEPNSVVYTGTHDNDTTRGWYAARTEAERQSVDQYLGRTCSEESVAWELIRTAWASVCRLAVAPMQDVLNLGTEARMNLPGVIGPENWSWRLPADYAVGDTAARLAAFSELYGRAKT